MFKEYPNRFSFIYDYCYFQELISEQNQVLSLTDKGKQFVLSGRTADLLDVYRFWLRLYKGAVPNMASLAHWVESLSKEWVRAESLARVICPLIKPFYYDTPDSIFHQRLLQMMMHLGLLSIGEDEQRGKVVRINKLGSRIVRGTYISDEELIELQHNG
jgi:predicted transcriptional regulator